MKIYLAKLTIKQLTTPVKFMSTYPRQTINMAKTRDGSVVGGKSFGFVGIDIECKNMSTK